MLKFPPCYKINKKLSPAKHAGFSFFRKSGIIFIFYIFLEVIKMLYEVLYETGSENYSKGDIHLLPLVSNTRRALKAISDCDIEELQNVLYIAEKFHSDKKYDKGYENVQVKLHRVLDFIKKFNKHFNGSVNKNSLKILEYKESAIVENIISLITQDDQLGFEETVVILQSLKPIVDRLVIRSEEPMANIYSTGLDICERYNTYGMNFAIIISSNCKWSIEYFIRGCNPRLDNIVKNGISSILGSKKEIKKLDGKLKKDLKLAYKTLVEKKYRFSLVERYRALFL